MLANLDYLHILVATVAYFLIGALWYSVLFGKTWVKLIGVTMTEDDKKNIPMMFAMTFVLNFVITFATAAVLYFIEPRTILAALKSGLLLGVGFVGASCAMNYMYSKRPFKLTLIDSGYHVVSIIVVCIILTLWR
jgi:hypothetical protein